MTLDHRQVAEWLREAAEDVAEWGAYASPYFQNKWNFEGTVAKWKQRADELEADRARTT